MSKAIPSPINFTELVNNCQGLISSNQPREAFELVAKTVVLSVIESQKSITTTRVKLGKLRSELNEAFKNAGKDYNKSITKNDVTTNIFLLSTLIKDVEDATGIQDGKASGEEDYNRVLNNVRIINDKVKGEIVLRESIIKVDAPDEPFEGIEDLEEHEADDIPEEIIKLNATKYLAEAKRLIGSNEWTDIAIGVAMATLRREVEVCFQMTFEAKGEYTLIISQPVKKYSTGEKYYEIPSLLPADDIEAAVIRMRKMVDFNRCVIQRQLGNTKKANEEFNNCYKQPLLERFNEYVRLHINTAASTKTKNTFHQLRSIGTAIYKEAKKATYKTYSDKYSNEVLKFVSGVLVHQSVSASAEYGNWDISSVPAYVVGLCNRTYGNVIKKEKSPMTSINININLSTLEQSIVDLQDEKAINLFNQIFTPERLINPDALGNALAAVFTQATREPEKKNHLLSALSTKTARGDIGTQRINTIIEAMMSHNAYAEYKVFICESQVRAAYAYIFGEQVSFNLVRELFNERGSAIPDHNAYKNLTTNDNLRLRGDKIKSVYDALKKLINEM